MYVQWGKWRCEHPTGRRATRAVRAWRVIELRSDLPCPSVDGPAGHFNYLEDLADHAGMRGAARINEVGLDGGDVGCVVAALVYEFLRHVLPTSRPVT